jgi:hypothetical protein
MDDQLGDAIDKTTGLTLDKFSTQSDLRREGAANDQDLAIKALLNDQGLSLDMLNEMSSEKLRSLAAQSGIDESMVLRKLSNREDVHAQNQGLAGTRMDEASYGRDIRNQDDILAHDLKTQRFDYGAGNRAANLDAQETGRQGQGQVMQTSYNQGNFQDQFGNRSFDQAKVGFDQTHQQEAANAGWGKKLLLGAAKAGLSMVPGAGPVAQGARFVGNAMPGPSVAPQQSSSNWATYKPPKVDTSAAGWGSR